MTQSDPYSRIYWRFIDEFPDVYNDDAQFAAWVRLLIAAEGVHPSSSSVPRSCKKSAIAKLVDSKLVVLVPGDRYRIRGLDAERERRSEAARIAGLASGRARAERSLNERSQTVERSNERSGNGSEPRRDETSKDETRQDEPSRGDAPRLLREPPSNELMLQQAYGVLADRTASPEAHRKAQAFIDGQRKSA